MAERKTSSTNYRNQSFLEEKCSLNELLDILSKRWMCDVLFSIEEGNCRFGSIKEQLVYITDHILADRLKILERYLLVARTLNEAEGRTEYTITERGLELSALLETMCTFSDQLFAD